MPRWLRWPGRRTPTDAEIAREMADHIDLDASELMAGGLPPHDARDLARRRFGNVSLLAERTRDVWTTRPLEHLRQDLRFAIRVLRRAPVFTAIATLCLAVGIGAHAAVLGWTRGVVLHPFPGVRDQERLVAVASTAKGATGYEETSWPDFQDLARDSLAFDAAFVSKITSATLTGGDRADRLVGQLVSANFFDATGVRPALGRGFLPGEDVGDRAHPVTVISYRLWRDRFRGDPAIVGKTIGFNNVPHTIVGVAPEEFLGTFVGYALQFWVPAAQQAVLDPSGYRLEQRGDRWVEGFARLRPGVTLGSARARVAALSRRLVAEYPNDDLGRSLVVLPLAENPFDNAKTIKPMLRTASMVAALLLLIVCANIANLLLVRGVSRRGEITTRRALGAGRWRLVRQLMTEGCLLALAGTALGLLIAYLSRNGLGVFFAPRNGARLVFGADFSAVVILPTVAIGVGATLLFALAPALYTTRGDLAAAIRAAAPAAGGTRGRLRARLVVVQVSLSVVLLVSAGLVATSVRRLLDTDPGFRMRDVATSSLNLLAAGYDSARARRFESELLTRITALPGVASAALAKSVPFGIRPYDNANVAVDGQNLSRAEQPTVDYDQVSPGYFATLGVALVEGRDFNAADADTAAPVAIVTRALATRYWPTGSPIGRRINLRGRWRTIVGVVADSKYRALAESPGTLLYVPLAQEPSSVVSVFLRSAGGAMPPTVAPGFISAVHAVDANVSPFEVLTMREQVDRSTAGQRLVATLLVTFSGVALFLATLGVYGTLSYTVAQRTREIGMRIALGAAPARVLAFMLGAGLRTVAVGIGLGVVAAAVTTPAMGELLYRVSPRDPIVLGSVAVVMLIAAAGACLVPAWRASRLDPVRALRL